MTRFSFEVPIAHLETFEDLQDFHFALSMLFAEERYKNFYSNLPRNKEVWLDNSFNEQERADESSTLVRLARDYHIDKVVCPDALDWDEKRICSSYQYMNVHLPSERLVTVVNSSEMLQYVKDNTSCRQFACAYRMRRKHLYADLEWTRECHFLGLNGPNELIYLQPPSCDTGMPIKLAIMHKSYFDWVREGFTHADTTWMPGYFNYVMSDREIQIARDNIKRLKEFVNG